MIKMKQEPNMCMCVCAFGLQFISPSAIQHTKFNFFDIYDIKLNNCWKLELSICKSYLLLVIRTTVLFFLKKSYKFICFLYLRKKKRKLALVECSAHQKKRELDNHIQRSIFKQHLMINQYLLNAFHEPPSFLSSNISRWFHGMSKNCDYISY